ncbi:MULTISPECIES: hypothetical protein [Brevibacterium]|uniref:Uncharacterized protein n=1 Tax=Brevibacterium antiquum CNRZ 918 TaxID=1255637 RepID=A0A2H1KDA3_9MICO|nr:MULTISPECIES: hypothetical protein [Brevibacterium]SMX97686.1 hypothetical protein BANT918_02349 [Brevibacterium antiquum CNRZ 918]HCG55364.1 hypothetical protein [Brevibacterium sp.]
MSKLTKKASAALWDELRDGFLNIEKTIIKIIEAKAWEPLGYATFAEAWADRMDGVRLAGEVRAHVVYAMLAEGEAVEAISARTGIGTGSVKDLRRQRSNGVPPEAATLVRQHTRGHQRPPYRLIVEFSPDEREQFAEACKRFDLDMTTEATEAIRAHFARLAQLTDKKAS